MKLLAVTMGKNLNVVLNLIARIEQTKPDFESAFYVSNAKNYLRTVDKVPALKSMPLLFEWELVNEGKSTTSSFETLAEYQSSYDVSLWNAVVADRRLFFGKNCKFTQDYSPRFSEAELVNILCYSIEKIEAFVRSFKPDLILSLGTATFGDYLFELVAKRQGYPVPPVESDKSPKLSAFRRQWDRGFNNPPGCLSKRCLY